MPPPRGRLLRPHVLRRFLLKFLCNCAQRCMIVRRFVMAHGAPIHRFRCCRRVRIFVSRLAIDSFCIRPPLFFERNPAQAHHELCLKLVFRQIPLNSHPLVSFRIEHKDAGRPGRIEAMEPCGMLLDVCFDRKEIRIDEVRHSLIRVRLGFQPSACPSSRSGAEINQNRPARLLCLGQRGIDVITPVD